MKTENYTPDEIDIIRECLELRLISLKKMNNSYFEPDVKTIKSILEDEEDEEDEEEYWRGVRFINMTMKERRLYDENAE